MLKDRFFGGTIPLPNVGKVFYFVSEMPNDLIAPVPKSNSALDFEAAIFSFTEWLKESYMAQNVFSFQF